MPKDAAIKSAARARQAETGESYQEARAAVVAEHDKPIEVELWYQGCRNFTLDTPEARKAWRQLPIRYGGKIDVESAAVAEFAAQYLGDDIGGLIADDHAYFEDGIDADLYQVRGDDEPAESTGLSPFPARELEAKDLSAALHRTVTPDQAVWLFEHYDGPLDEYDCVDDDYLAGMADRLPMPAELAASAVLARYAAALADFDLAKVKYSFPRKLGVVALFDGLHGSSDRGDFVQAPSGWPPEVWRVRVIMDCATAAGDVVVLHQCVDTIAAWMKKIAEWSAGQEEGQ